MVVLLLSSLFGIVVHILSKLAHLERAKQTFRFAIWLRKNKFRTLYSLVTSVGMAILLSDTQWMDPFSAFFVGFSTDSFVKNLVSERTKLSDPFKSETKK
jgi:divalent metal cation (Fe/Co/Zn/Cd) transporter